MHINILTRLIFIKNTFECVMQRVGKGKEHIKTKRVKDKAKSRSRGSPGRHPLHEFNVTSAENNIYLII